MARTRTFESICSTSISHPQIAEIFGFVKRFYFLPFTFNLLLNRVDFYPQNYTYYVTMFCRFIILTFYRFLMKKSILVMIRKNTRILLGAAILAL